MQYSKACLLNTQENKQTNKLFLMSREPKSYKNIYEIAGFVLREVIVSLPSILALLGQKISMKQLEMYNMPI